MISPRRTSRDGFNLLEVVIATLIFNCVVVFSVGLWATHARALGKARHRMIATFLAERVMEQSLADGYYSLKNKDDFIEMSTIMRGNENVVKYDWHLEVEAYPGEDNLKVVVVRVEWPDEQGVRREVRYETLLSRNSG